MNRCPTLALFFYALTMTAYGRVEYGRVEYVMEPLCMGGGK